MAGHGDPYLVGNIEGSHEVRLRQNHCKLLTAKPSDHIGFATIVDQALGNNFQRLIACQVPKGIVVILEVVYIQDDDRQLAYESLTAINLIFEKEIKISSVSEPCESV